MALAQLAAGAAGLRAYPGSSLKAIPEPRLACTPELGLADAGPSRPPAAAGAARVPSHGPVQPGPAKRSQKKEDQCRAGGWVQEAADCKFREGPQHFLHKFGGFWNGTMVDPGSQQPKIWKCPLTVDSLKSAARPYGHEGARLRLRRAMDRLSRGLNVTIAVIGPSMTMGTQTQRAWPARLQDLFNRLELPVKVKNLARGGTTSEWAVASFREIKGQLLKADIVMVDYGINDREKAHHDVTVIRKIYRDLVKLLITLPNKPGIVDVQTFMETPLILTRSTSEVKVPTDDCSAVDLRTYHHWPVNQELNVPMISYTEAVCRSNRTWWMMEFKDVEAKGSPHPGVITHDLLARVALGFFLGELEHVCSKGVGGEDFKQGLEAQLDSHIQCLMQPSTVYNASSFKPSVVDDDAWFFGADVPGKPQGWIARSKDAEPESKPGNLVFNVETRSGWIQMEYLGTYQNIGFVDVWLDDHVPHNDGCQVDGHWADHTSQSKFSLLKTGLGPGNHTLWIRSNGGKFKLLGITAC